MRWGLVVPKDLEANQVALRRENCSPTGHTRRSGRRERNDRDRVQSSTSKGYTGTMKNAAADILGAIVTVASTAFAAWWMMAA